MSGNRVRLLFLNVGHAYAHYFMLIHPTVAVALESRGQGDYGALLLPATAGFVAFAAFTLPAGWLGDRWSRHGMMAVMFLGLGVASLLTAFASGPFQMAAGLFLMGSFAAIYHPVGIALVAESGEGVGQALGVNGVWGNMGVAAAPLVTGALTGMFGWQAAFLIPGALCLASGIAYLMLVPAECGKRGASAVAAEPPAAVPTAVALPGRILAYLVITALMGGLVFAATTVVLPKVMEDAFNGGGNGLVSAAGLASMVFACASVAQLVTGRAVDRVSPRQLMLLLALLQVPLFLLMGQAGQWWVVALSLGLMITVFGVIPVQDAIVARHTASDWRARVYAVKYVLSLGVGALAVPVVAWGYDPASGFIRLYLLLAACAVGVAMAALLLPARRYAQAALGDNA
ncbi:MFS transporter [Halomonas sp. MCCC 1A17488]|uniref:MFS transporter n=1 Tax=unclassified Halomonas TaxID=2609666 RepID=UPI0018D256EF|nr:MULTISPECIES: MFS transporter [unclassified Halomonas]MCE8016560.1 MFS transporter [Halomonas sp. MCCC 1A17488]MCG3239893.1 MFS transporter [Halomonas sp. MCCC 1A17488]QPP50213.1 MFS transporter [Halomonas sp. SS10-MC5]